MAEIPNPLNAITNKGQQLYGAAKQKVTNLWGPRQDSTPDTDSVIRGFLKGSASYPVEAMVGNTADKVVKTLGNTVDMGGRIASQWNRTLTDTPYISGQFIKELVKSPIGTMAGGVKLIGDTVGTGMDWGLDMVEGVNKSIDQISYATRKGLSYIPVIGGILGQVGSGTLNVMNRFMDAPRRIAKWTREKAGKVLGWPAGKISDWTLGGGGGGSGAPEPAMA